MYAPAITVTSPGIMASIYDIEHASELGMFIDGLLSKISSTHGVDYCELLDTVSYVRQQGCDSEEVELITINNKNYWYCTSTKKVYSYNGKVEVIGVLDKDLNIIPINAIKTIKKIHP
jgi:hypothetical protein